LKNGDLLFSWSGTLDVSIWCRGSGALNQHLFKVTPYTLPKGLIYLYLKNHLSNFQIIAANKATTMGHIQRSHLNEAKILVPNSEMALTITRQLQPMFDLMVQNLVEAKNIGNTRDYLLPKLISGEIRIKEAEMRIKELI
jgi:type I restriction enzyme, S subunit